VADQSAYVSDAAFSAAVWTFQDWFCSFNGGMRRVRVWDLNVGPSNRQSFEVVVCVGY
jgi:hypothetical protein